MNDAVQEFLRKYPTTSRWLEDITDVIISYAGRAHVQTIALELSKNYTRDINSIKETVTRSINNYCSDAADFKKSQEFDLFERIEPNTFRLRAYPSKPKFIELMKIDFEDPLLNGMWKEFCEIAKKKKPEKWNSLSNRERLQAFIKWISLNTTATELQRRKDALARGIGD